MLEANAELVATFEDGTTNVLSVNWTGNNVNFVGYTEEAEEEFWDAYFNSGDVPYLDVYVLDTRTGVTSRVYVEPEFYQLRSNRKRK